MLVLSRKASESVIISVNGIEIEVVVAEVRGDKVRLGFDGPREVGVYRREVYDAMQHKMVEKPCQTT